ncbi:hypothetical protein EDB83DRAFT_2313075 [Lactarius deliciosus]|nr:hypothetical protein EDB83DRAFT_2313075 [Lactarius deliciosus]
MLVVKASSSCDVCLEPFQLRADSSPIIRAPCAIDCGHIFCSTYFDPRAVRRLHIDVALRTPDVRPSRVGHPDNDVSASKEDLKDRIISIVRNGADGGHYQALIQETCAWLKEQTPEEHWDLRALYLLLIRYHQMHKDEQAATVSLHEKTKHYQDALRRAEKRQQEIAELKQTIEDLNDKMESNEVQRAVREKQLTNTKRQSKKHEASVNNSCHSALLRDEAVEVRKLASRISEFSNLWSRMKVPTMPLLNLSPIHFSPLPIHLSPVQLTVNAVSPLLKSVPDPAEEEDHYFKPRPQSTEDADHTPVEYPTPLVSTPASKPMAIGATIARFYDMAASETSASLPHPTPSTYYNRRHEKEKEKQRELSRNNSSGGTGRVALSRIRALQEKLVPESGDEAERARSTRRQLLNAILADAPTPQSTPAPILSRGCTGDRARARAPSPSIERKSRCRNASRPPTTTSTSTNTTADPCPGSHAAPYTLSPIDTVTQGCVRR